MFHDQTHVSNQRHESHSQAQVTISCASASIHVAMRVVKHCNKPIRLRDVD